MEILVFLIGFVVGVLFTLAFCGLTLTVTKTEEADPKRVGVTLDHQPERRTLRRGG